MLQPFKKIGIIGMGLIGGSIAKRLKMDPTHSVFSMRHEVETADSSVDWVFEEYDAFIARCDLIVIATPIACIVEIAKKIKDNAPGNKKTVVIDVASVKREICSQFELLTEEHIEFIGTHPMAGKDCWGFENSEPTLFQNARWIVCPHAKNQVGTLAALGQWIEKLGAHEVKLIAEDHDKKAALISHFPGLLSQLFLAFVEQNDKSAIDIAGSGFQSMTRLAHDNPSMRQEILSLNDDHVKELMREWINFLNKQGEFQ